MGTSKIKLTPTTHEEMKFFSILEEMGQVFLRKHHDYGPRNIAITGDKGIIVRMADKVMRLVNLRLDNPDRDPKNESIDDAFLDVAIYGAIALLCRRGDWPGVPAIDPDGEEPEKP
jgi:hypothetical protein